LKHYLEALDNLGVAFPMWVCLSLLGVKGYCITRSHVSASLSSYSIDRDDLIIPEIEVPDANKPAAEILRSAFDAVWNACGQPYCKNYDTNGTWLLSCP
jgi:hypothetical protein